MTHLNGITRLISMLALAVLALPSIADFELGMQYYESGQFEKAHREFLAAAQRGDYSAQFNIGAMYYRGEAVEQDTVQSYAWFALAAQIEEYASKGLHKKFYEKFSEEDKARADKAYEDLMARYSDAAIEERLTPNYQGTNLRSKQFRILKQITPKYPRMALRQGRVGWVDVLFTIDKDGTTRDHLVYYSSHRDFTNVALDALRQWQYEPALSEGKPVAITAMRNRFTFNLDEQAVNAKRFVRVIDEHKEKAATGDEYDKFNYAYLLDIAPSYVKDFESDDNPNEWYAKAAIDGHSTARFLLGRNIIYGDRCAVEPDKGKDWILQAAAQGLSEAHYMLATELLSGVRFEKNIEQAFYWLGRAAKSNTAAKLKYAWILSTSDEPEQRNLAKAKEYLDEVDKKYHDKRTLYQVHAAVSAESGDFKRAIKWQEKALKDSQQLELPTKELEERLAAYHLKKPWREAL